MRPPPGAPTPVAGQAGAPANSLLFVYGEAVKQSGASWTAISDERTKKDITPFSEGLNELLQVKPKKFKYNGLANTPDNLEEIGVLAQDIRQIFPYMVSAIQTKLKPEDEAISPVLTFNGSALQFVMINAIKEIHERLTQLEQLLKKQ
jgi:hypothetical protein